MTHPAQFARERILLVSLGLALLGCFLFLRASGWLEQKTPFQQGSNAYDHGNYDKALAAFNQAIQLDPKIAYVYNNRGAVYFHKGDYDRAFADYDQAIRLDPTYVFAYNNRGNVYQHKGDYDKAIADYDKAIQLDPKYAGAYDNRVNAYKAKGDYAKAIASYEQIIPLNPKDAQEYNNFAWLLATCPQAGLRDGKKAVENATKACALSEWKDPGAVNTLSAACAEAGDFDNAVKWESQFLETPDLFGKVRADAQSRLALYQAHQPYHLDK